MFGPVPRSHEHDLPKKVRRAALCGALSLRRREGKLAVVEDLALEEGRTRLAVEQLRGLGFDGSESVLIVAAGDDPRLARATRNLRWVGLLPPIGVNTYDVLRHDRLLLTRAAVDALHARLGRGVGAAEGGS